MEPIPESAVRELVIVLPLVPGAVVEQPVLQVGEQAGRTEDDRLHGVIVPEHQVAGQQRRVVPHLTVRTSLVELGDQGDAGFDELLPDLAALRVVAGRLQQVEGHTELQQPDRFEVGAEERTRGPEHVVPVRVLEIGVGVLAQHVGGEFGVPGVAPHREQRRRVHGTFRQPEMVRVQPPAVVQLAVVHLPAARAPVLVRRPGIEAQRCAVAFADASRAREQRLLPRNRDRRGEDAVEIGGQRIGERRERTAGGAPPWGEHFGIEKQGH